MSANNGTDTGHLPVTDTSLYGYVPSHTITIIFFILFLVTTVTHFVQAIKHRTWFMLWTVTFCGCLELLGWFCRVWSSYHPRADLPFEIQITACIVAPTPLLAANFVMVGRIVRILGQKYIKMSQKPRLFTFIFTTCDITCLFVQGLGGAVAGSAHTLDGANRGARIMLIGIVIQLVIVILFSISTGEYFVLYRKDARSSPSYEAVAGSDGVVQGPGIFSLNLRNMTYALAFNMTCLFIRAIYRTIELSGGWNGRVIHTQVYFNVLDGAMIVLAMFVTNFFHPGALIRAPTTRPVTSMSMTKLTESDIA